MKIKSNFKDYYDYISNQFGGGDPKIVYIRNRISHVSNHKSKKLYNGDDIFEIHLDCKIPYALTRMSFYDKISFAVLVVAGVGYLIYSIDNRNWSFINDTNMNEIVNQYNKERFNDNITIDDIKSFINYNGDYSAVAKLLNSPVFIILHQGQVDNLIIEDRIPCLKDIGFDKIMSPQQCYQNIEYFICNVLRDNPDIKPPVQVEDIVRLAQHGFDKKISFRHRKIV